MTPNLTVEVGDRIPEFTFKTAKIAPDGACPMPMEVKASSVFSNKNIVLVGVPGAFTPTCSGKHVPGFVEALPALKAKGIDAVAVTAVNDPHVMAYWAESMKATGSLEMLADGNGTFARALGMEADMSKAQMGMRSRRYAMIVRDGIIKYLGIDDNGLDKSSVDAVLANLR